MHSHQVRMPPRIICRERIYRYMLGSAIYLFIILKQLVEHCLSESTVVHWEQEVEKKMLPGGAALSLLYHKIVLLIIHSSISLILHHRVAVNCTKAEIWWSPGQMGKICLTVLSSAPNQVFGTELTWKDTLPLKEFGVLIGSSGFVSRCQKIFHTGVIHSLSFRLQPIEKKHIIILKLNYLE